MSNAQALRIALHAHDQATARAADLQTQLRDLEARDLATMDTVADLAAALDTELGRAQLGEATPEAVNAARTAHAAAVEQSRGIDRAKDMVRSRIAAQGQEIAGLHQGIARTMGAIAEPLLAEAHAAVEYHTQELGKALGLLYRLDNCARLGQGFRTGQDAHEFAGCPGYVLAQHGIRAENGCLYPQFRERIDDIRPATLLALLEDS